MECGAAVQGTKWSISLAFAEGVANIGFPGVTPRRVFVYGNAFLESLRTVRALFSYVVLFVIYHFVLGGGVSAYFSFVVSLIPWPLLLLFQFFKPVFFVCVAIYLVTTFVVGVERFIEKFVIEVNTRRNAEASESSGDDSGMSESSVDGDEQEGLGSDGSPFYHRSFTWSSQQYGWGWRFEGRFQEYSFVRNSQHSPGSDDSFSFHWRAASMSTHLSGILNIIRGLIAHLPFISRYT